MILDRLELIDRYSLLHAGFARAAATLRSMFGAPPELGKYVIDPDRLFVIVARDQGRGRELSPLEFHRRYIDIQLVLEGADLIGWKALAECHDLSEPYQVDRDIGFFRDPAHTWLHIPVASFAIFFPDDAHAPLATDKLVTKAVAKIAVDW